MYNQNNRIVLDKKRNRYIVYYNKKSFSYSINRYGELAIKIAKLSLRDGKKYYDYFENNKNKTITFYINTHAYGIKEVLIDEDDFFVLSTSKISIKKDRYTYYAETKINKVHRMIMNVTDKKQIVDHINHNGLDNTKKNLRIVNTSLNNKNAKIRKDNKTGYKGITEDNKRFRLFYYGTEHNKMSKSFSKIKYGYDKALKLILEFREKVYKENEYLA